MNHSSALLVLLAAGAPLAVALLMVARSWRHVVARAAPVAALPALVLVLVGPVGAKASLPWLVQHAVLELDAVGRIFLGFTSVLWLVSGWYARGYLAKDANPVRFNLLFLLAMGANFTLILAGDIPTFYTAFALMGLASAGLVFHRGDAEAARAGRIYLALAMLAEVLILSGLVFVAVAGGTTRIAELHRGVFSQPALALLLAGFGIKAGALTLHFWLPLAHPAAPVPASAVLSGAIIKAGLLGWIRFLPLGEAVMRGYGFTLIGAGLGAALLGTVVGVAQTNAKTVLAYSSIGQMGIMMSGLGIGAIQPEAWPALQTAVLIYATHHALAKGALFLGVGQAHAARTKWQRIEARVGLLLPALALAGAPFTSGALGKTALKANVSFLPEGWAFALGLLLPLTAVGTTLKMARFLWLTWPPPGRSGEESRRGLRAPWMLLVAATLVGVWLLPGALGVLYRKLSLDELWAALWPLLVGGILAALGAWLRHWSLRDLSRWLPAGDLGVPLERLLARLQLDAPTDARSHGERKPDHNESPEREASRWSMPFKRAGEAIVQFEAHLRSWPVAGALWLLLTALLVGLLAASNH